MKKKFDIQGMTCSSCSSHVEKAVNKLKGIKSVNVNLLSNNMMVEYDEEILTDEEIIKSVIDVGYGASVLDEKKSNIKKEKLIDNKDNIKYMKKRLIISVCFLIPLMYIAMHHMLNEWFRIPVPQIIKNLFHGNENRSYFWIYAVFIIVTNCIC